MIRQKKSHGCLQGSVKRSWTCETAKRICRWAVWVISGAVTDIFLRRGDMHLLEKPRILSNIKWKTKDDSHGFLLLKFDNFCLWLDPEHSKRWEIEKVHSQDDLWHLVESLTTPLRFYAWKMNFPFKEGPFSVIIRQFSGWYHWRNLGNKGLSLSQKKMSNNRMTAST